MDTVGLRELKNSLAEYVRQVAEGKSLLVTDRGRPVAELRPVSDEQTAGAGRLSLEDLIRAGLLTPGKRNDRKLYPALARVGRRPSADLLDDERGRR
jgi:prevent-host-death family protein